MPKSKNNNSRDNDQRKVDVQATERLIETDMMDGVYDVATIQELIKQLPEKERSRFEEELRRELQEKKLAVSELEAHNSAEKHEGYKESRDPKDVASSVKDSNQIKPEISGGSGAHLSAKNEQRRTQNKDKEMGYSR